MNEFIRVCNVNEIKENQGKRFLVDDVDVAIFKVNSKIHAVSNICPHQHASKIYDGFIENGKVVCPLHGWEFNISTGKMFGGNSGLDVYEVKIENNYVYVKVFKQELNW